VSLVEHDLLQHEHMIHNPIQEWLNQHLCFQALLKVAKFGIAVLNLLKLRSIFLLRFLKERNLLLSKHCKLLH